jgi:pimeloyl-ACP methyl ester carboxylesterase
MELTNFYLCGHSFGGYVAGNYSLKYYKHIKKLVMLSPIGIRVKDPEDNEDPFEGGGPPTWIKKIANYSWKKKISPFSYGRFLGKFISLKAIKRYVINRLKLDNEES